MWNSKQNHSGPRTLPGHVEVLVSSLGTPILQSSSWYVFLSSASYLVAEFPRLQSRHRYVRNLDLSEEMASDGPSDEDDEESSMSPNYYEGITSAQKAQMISGLDHVRSVVGTGVVSDREIREQLWETYFDVDSVVNWWYDKEEKEKAEKEKQKGRLILSSLSCFASFLLPSYPSIS